MSIRQGDARHLPQSLRELGDTLRAERAALVANDCDAILRLADTKLTQLKRLQDGGMAQRAALAEFDAELRELAALNVANGALIARRRHETQWTLRQLGLETRAGSYDAHGAFGHAIAPRARAKA